MYFYDIDPMTLEPGSRYYFNVTVYVMPVAENDSSIMPLGVDDQWYLEKITDARPVIYGLYRIDDDDTLAEVECYPHAVVEITKEQEVMWYEMLRYERDSNDLWEIDEEDDENDEGEDDDYCI